MKSILFAIALIIFIGVPAEISGQASEVAQSFANYFSPQILRAVDAIMKDRSCTSDGYWKIWTYGFYRSFRGADGKKFKTILNWDGFWYKEIGSDVIKEGDWTSLK